jgi:hypothetical protein
MAAPSVNSPSNEKVALYLFWTSSFSRVLLVVKGQTPVFRALCQVKMFAFLLAKTDRTEVTARIAHNCVAELLRPVRYDWWSKSLAGGYVGGVIEKLSCYEIPDEYMVEMGRGLSTHLKGLDTKDKETVHDAVALYNRVCDLARNAIICFIIAARKQWWLRCMNKDVRKIIARMLWSERDAWKKRAPKRVMRKRLKK